MPEHDVLIIGAGLAGQRAALAAAQAGASVAILSKVHPVRSHSVAAADGINAALKPEDTWESHAFDTVKGSDYLGDEDGSCVGCIARDIRTGEMQVFQAKNVILASGGAGQAWKPTTNGLVCTGD